MAGILLVLPRLRLPRYSRYRTRLHGRSFLTLGGSAPSLRELLEDPIYDASKGHRQTGQIPSVRFPTVEIAWRPVLNNPKRHHTVPKFYLRGFAEGKKLGAVNVRTGARHTTSVADATVEVNFYTVRDHATDPNEFEATLSQMEGVAAAVHRAIVGGRWPLAPHDRAAFAAFMTLQFLRLRSHRWQMYHTIAADLRDLANNNPEEFDRILSLPGAPSREAIAGANLASLVSSAVHIQQITTMVPRLVEHLLGRPWELVRFESPSLLTSDEPITPLANPAEPQSVGLGLENSWALMFPLSREVGLLMFRDPMGFLVDAVAEDIARGRFDTARCGDPESAHLFNTNTAMHAHMFAYHHPDDAHLMPEQVTELAKRGGRINLEDLPEGLLPAE